MLACLVFGPMAAAVICYIAGKYNKNLRNIVSILVTFLEVAILMYLGMSVLNGNTVTQSLPGICSMGMNFTLDGFRLLYGFVAAFMWAMTTLFSPQYFAHYRNRNRYYFFVLMTLGATVGVFLSADLFTTFICFEIMSFTSYVWVAQEEKPLALRAAETYLAVAVIGGMVMLMGLFLLYYSVGTLEIAKLYEACASFDNKSMLYAAGICMLFGFGAKAGMYPLHIWLPKAHPVAPAPSSALLSGILTKSGVYGILAVSCNIFRHDEKWGMMIYLLGLITMFTGAFIALFSINLKRTLACSSMSQIGFILVGIGMQGLLGEENALACRGTILHMVNHSMIKLILFMAAGVVFFNIHKLELDDIRGFGRKKPILTACFAVGALSISGVPLFSGYVSKTLLHESIVEYIEEIEHTAMYMPLKASEWVFLVTGGMTFAYMLKLFICVFIEKNKDAALQEKYDAMNGKYMNVFSTTALIIPSIMLFVMGILPYNTMNEMAHITLPFMSGEEPEHFVHYFSLGNLKGSAISLAIGALVYLAFIRLCLTRKDEKGAVSYVNIWPEWLDLENSVYRPIIQHIIPFILAFVLRCFDKLSDGIIYIVRNTILAPHAEGYVHTYGTPMTKALGQIMNGLVAILNVTIFRKNKINKDYTYELAAARLGYIKSSRVNARSVSHGLLLFAAGFMVTIIYLIYKMKMAGY